MIKISNLKTKFEENIKYGKKVKFDQNIKIEKNVKFDQNIKIENNVNINYISSTSPTSQPLDLVSHFFWTKMKFWETKKKQAWP